MISIVDEIRFDLFIPDKYLTIITLVNCNRPVIMADDSGGQGHGVG